MSDSAGDPTTDDELSQDYKQAGFNNKLGMGSAPAVVVVDMCRAYFDPDSPLFAGVPEVVDACVSLVDAARAAGRPVLWARVEYEPGGAIGEVATAIGWPNSIPPMAMW